MTFAQAMREQTGVESVTTFWEDFAVADRFGAAAVEDTYRRAFNEWADDYHYLAELALVLNWRIWHHHEAGNLARAELYDRLWRQTDEYAKDELRGEAAEYYYQVTD